MKKNCRIVFLIVTLLLLFSSISFCEEEEDDSIIALPGHELGDQIFSLRAGLVIPLFFHDFDGNTYDSNSTIGASGAIQWNFYLTNYLRLGIDIGLAFSLDPNKNLYNMIPITFNVAYVISVSRFEFPISLSSGINILNYADIYHLGILIKPAIAAYWRYDANLSFGLNIAYWWTMEFPIEDYSAVAGNFIDITPSLFYHF